MKSSKMNKMKKRLLALLLCMVMMMNGSVPALASEVTASDEVNAISQDAGTQTASLETVHEHTGECYSRSKVSDALICGKEVVEGHTHGDTCYEVTNTSECICTLEETAGHSHDEGCYTTVETKNCSLEEHSHGDGCYTTEITCGTEEHSHGDECFTTETINVCGQEEVEAHTHGDGCYTTVENKTLTCELEEAEGHAHSDECYEWTEELTCTIPTETPTVEPEITTCEVCGKETCECEAEIEICEVCGKETCECEAEEEAEPITLTTEVDGTTITLSGPAEAFTEGMVYSIEAAIVETTQEVEVIEEVLEEVAVEQEKVVKNYQAFDIKIIEKDEEGNVIDDDFQPLNKTPVMVTFSSKEVAESVENEETETNVLHVDTEKKEAEDMAAEVTEDKDVAIETTHFSIYVYVEFSVIGEIKLFVEHWIEDSEEKLYNDSEIVLENGFRGSVGDLGEICFGDQVDLGWVVSKVYRDVEGEWEELTEDIVLTEDTKLKVEYVPDYQGATSFSKFNFRRAGAKAAGKIQKNKTATQLDKNWESDVELSVGGVATGEPIDIIFVLGGGMTANKKTVNSAIKVFESVMQQKGEGAPTVKIGIISLEKGQEIILELKDGTLDPETYEQFITEQFDYINTLPGGSTNLHSQLKEAARMLEDDKSVKPENKYMFVIATGRTYWFDDENGNQATIINKVNAGGATRYYWGDYLWKSQRGGHTSLYMIPDCYKDNWDAYWSDVCKWVEADGNNYVYTAPWDGTDIYGYSNWYSKNNKDVRAILGSGSRYGLVIVDPAPTKENFVEGVVNAIGSENHPLHALNYERAHYESAKVYQAMVDAGYNCFAICSENPNYQNNSEYITLGAQYEGTSRTQLGHSFMNYLARLGGQTEAPAVWDYERDEDGNFLSATPVLQKDFFKSVEAHIIKSLSRDSRVEDYIGYSDGTNGEEAYDFDFVDKAENLVLSIGSDGYAATKIDTSEGATSTYSFKNGAHIVDYFKGNTTTTERFVWTINEDVVGKVASLKYTVFLKTKDTETVGKHIAYTNQSATLYPKDSDGNEGTPEDFEKPTVSYNVMKLDILKTDTNQTKVLEGAEFALSLKNPEVKDKIFLTKSGFAEKDGVVKATSITGTDGKATFKVISTLDAVECSLKETKSPSGYMLDESEREVTLNGNKIIEIAITNMPIYELPSTGGYGSFLYTLSGAALVLGSSLMKYKKNREEELGSEE